MHAFGRREACDTIYLGTIPLFGCVLVVVYQRVNGGGGLLLGQIVVFQLAVSSCGTVGRLKSIVVKVAARTVVRTISYGRYSHPNKSSS